MFTLMLGLNGPLNFCNNFDPINLKSMRSHSLRAKKISYCEGEDNGITITIRNLPDVEIAIVQISPHPTRTRGNQPSRLEADTPSPGPGADTPWTRGRYPPTRGIHSPLTRGRHTPGPEADTTAPGRDGHYSGRNASHWNAFLF